jgi:hypothetical protein
MISFPLKEKEKKKNREKLLIIDWLPYFFLYLLFPHKQHSILGIAAVFGLASACDALRHLKPTYMYFNMHEIGSWLNLG